jgi:anti-sigma B factor antagonist
MSDFGAAVRHRADHAVIDLRGDLDGRATAGMGEIYEQAIVGAPRTVVLNFAAVDYINSTGIALIVGLLGRTRGAQIAVHVVGLSEHYRHIFEITRLADFMSFFPDEDAAVEDGMTAPA